MKRSSTPQAKAYQAAYRALNKERLQQQNAVWRAANAERIAEYQAKWRAENADRKKIADAAYQRAHPQERAAANRRWAAKHADRVRAQKAKYVRENRNAYRVYCRNRKARLRGSGGKLSKDLATRLLEKQSGLCAMCACSLFYGYELDHHIPVSRGGLNVDDNIQLLCRPCNRRKSNKLPSELGCANVLVL